jgi:RHS repeat-associated protein
MFQRCNVIGDVRNEANQAGGDEARKGLGPTTAQLLASESRSGAVSGTVIHTYDDNFFRTALQVNGEPAVAFGYDGDGLLTQAGSLVLTRDAGNGILTATSLGLANDTWDFSLFGELESYSAEVDSSAAYSVDFVRDALGRIVEKTESVAGEPAVTTRYDYDPAGRLWRVKDATDTVLSEYLYDDNGNRAAGSFTTQAGAVLDADYDDQDRLTSYETTLGGAISFTYTANGELLSKTNTSTNTTTSYSYDALGNLRQVVLHEGEPNEQTIDYLIDGRNRRIGKKVDGNLTRQWLYRDQLNPVAELDGSGTLVAQFVYGTKANVPDYMLKNGITYRILSDHLGSVRLVVDVSTPGLTLEQRIAQRLDYDEFGNVLADTNPGFQAFGFAGGIYDADTGLVRFGARDYDGTAGRWTLKDPIRFSAGDTNLFGYGFRDPVNFVDPSGLETVVITVNGGILPTSDHAAVRVDNAGDPIIYDPGGSYRSATRGSGDAFYGSEADLEPFIDYQTSDGSEVTLHRFRTTPEEETEIAKRIHEQGGRLPLLCARGTSQAISGIGPFMNLGSYLTPGGLAAGLDALCKPDICERQTR